MDELLQADALRDIVAKEASDLLDAMARDVFWRGTDNIMEGLPFLPLPSIVPRLLPSPPPLVSKSVCTRITGIVRS